MNSIMTRLKDIDSGSNRWNTGKDKHHRYIEAFNSTINETPNTGDFDILDNHALAYKS